MSRLLLVLVLAFMLVVTTQAAALAAPDNGARAQNRELAQKQIQHRTTARQDQYLTTTGSAVGTTEADRDRDRLEDGTGDGDPDRDRDRVRLQDRLMDCVDNFLAWLR